jgi:hypothetical protein
MKVFFGSKKIGTVRSVSPDSTVELELTHPRGINMIMGPDKSKVRIGRK